METSRGSASSFINVFVLKIQEIFSSLWIRIGSIIMQIDRQLILRLQELARLELSEEQQVRIQADLGDILNMIEQLQKLDTQDVEPLIYISETYNSLRPDEISNQLERTKAMENAPLTDGTYFKVPKVIQIK